MSVHTGTHVHTGFFIEVLAKDHGKDMLPSFKSRDKHLLPPINRRESPVPVQ